MRSLMIGVDDGECQAPMRHLDTRGLGTSVAGIIRGLFGYGPHQRDWGVSNFHEATTGVVGLHHENFRPKTLITAMTLVHPQALHGERLAPEAADAGTADAFAAFTPSTTDCGRSI